MTSNLLPYIKGLVTRLDQTQCTRSSRGITELGIEILIEQLSQGEMYLFLSEEEEEIER
jgi:hypothetical protein